MNDNKITVSTGTFAGFCMCCPNRNGNNVNSTGNGVEFEVEKINKCEKCSCYKSGKIKGKETIHVDNDYVDLESILRNGFGSSKPFLKTPKIYHDRDGEKSYEYFTKSGAEAYGKLTSVIYALENLGVLEDANEIVENLDDIVSENY